jgi:transglutaminase-like putative cysteine protease
MQLEAGCTLSFTMQAPVPMVLMLRPRSGLGQWVVRESYDLTPHVPVTEYTDGFGNLCQRLITPEGPFRVEVKVTVDAADLADGDPLAAYVPVEQLPEDVLQFLLPSRYCESDKLGEKALEIVGSAAPGYAQVEAIRAWIHQNVAYQYGVSTPSTSAADTIGQRQGVCRDYSHLGIALCRSLNIPARMVVGYLYKLDPMDLHAWFEAYVGGRWYTFDATQPTLRGNRITIAYGRDAADVALSTQFGPGTLDQMHVWVEAAPVTQEPPVS